ncbi:unnamed protein product [Fraxinus pennsylvanica]|uniref:Uncharacterized protein n=1 Tax=Fraxinus pennsylvanica TaxID=56036 RepID=A0AAD2AJX0_9LAMI|nr:unnamed protein product [Fraxinus pennsylvanica]
MELADVVELQANDIEGAVEPDDEYFVNGVSDYGVHFLLLPQWEAITLGFQHYVLALGTAVIIPSFLVPLMGTDEPELKKQIEFESHAKEMELKKPKERAADPVLRKIGQYEPAALKDSISRVGPYRRQPSLPPVLPRVSPELLPMSPSIVADPGLDLQNFLKMGCPLPASFLIFTFVSSVGEYDAPFV